MSISLYSCRHVRANISLHTMCFTRACFGVGFHFVGSQYNKYDYIHRCMHIHVLFFSFDPDFSRQKTWSLVRHCRVFPCLSNIVCVLVITSLLFVCLFIFHVMFFHLLACCSWNCSRLDSFDSSVTKPSLLFFANDQTHCFAVSLQSGQPDCMFTSNTVNKNE